jgi:hypothetical protein
MLARLSTSRLPIPSDAMTRTRRRLGGTIGLLGLALLVACVSPERYSELDTPTTATRAAAPTAAPAVVDVRGLPVLRLHGTPRQMGFQHGRALAAGIKEGIVEFCFKYRCHSIPARYAEVCKTVASEVDLPDRVRDELDGMLEGMKASGTDLSLPPMKRDLELIDLELMNTIDHWGLFGCSGFTAWGRCTKDGEVLTARNFDFDVDPEKKAIAKLGVVLVFEPSDGRRFVSFGFPGLVGIASGVNESGVAAFLHVGNGAFGGGEEGKSRPLTLLLREVMERCGEKDAAQHLRDAMPGARVRNSFLLRLATSGVDAPPTTVFEVDPLGFEEEPLPDEHAGAAPLMIATNHYLARRQDFTAIPDSKIRYMNLEEATRKCLSLADHVIDPAEAWSALATASQQANHIVTLHALVFAPARKELWVQLCAVDASGRSTAATRRPPVHVTLAELFGDANVTAAHTAK